MLFGDVSAPGEAVEVVGLHGWRRSRGDITRCLAGIDSVAFDLPGFGASPPPAKPMGAAGYAELVVNAVGELTRDPVVMLGHSFGGRVAVCAAAQYPDRVRALVLTGVPLLRPSAMTRPRFRFRLARTLNRWSLVSDARMERLRQQYGSDDYRQATGVMRAVLVRVVNESYEKELGRLTCPVELVWGQRDTAAPLATAEQALPLIARGNLTVLEGVGHDTPAEAPDQLRAIVTQLSAQPA
jgi:pimeloyl-ACP methyl ester carboxylesterase